MTDHGYDTDSLPENIHVTVTVKDPNAYDGQKIHQRYVLTDRELQSGRMDPRTYLEQVIQELGGGVARKWADDRVQWGVEGQNSE